RVICLGRSVTSDRFPSRLPRTKLSRQRWQVFGLHRNAVVIAAPAPRGKRYATETSSCLELFVRAWGVLVGGCRRGGCPWSEKLRIYNERCQRIRLLRLRRRSCFFEAHQ